MAIICMEKCPESKNGKHNILDFDAKFKMAVYSETMQYLWLFSKVTILSLSLRDRPQFSNHFLLHLKLKSHHYFSKLMLKNAIGSA